jgi:CRISPR/Cas system CSM-associated protein Csm3 (group 7 of RAMP superfamily)
MNISLPVFHYTHLVLEALTPHGIHSGHGDATHDVVLLRDANGLPAIPASSLAGVLRHLYEALHGEEETRLLFGYVDGEVGQPSALTFTWGLVHDSQNVAREGIRSDVATDPILQFLAQDKPLVRQRVRLNERGAASGTGKFDTTHIPAGARYSFFVSFWSDGSEVHEARINNLLALLHTPGFRLGHGTRSGQGAFVVQSMYAGCWDLRTQDGRDSYRNRSRQRRAAGNLEPIRVDSGQNSGLTITLQLQAEAGWRIGGGELSFSALNEQNRTPDLLPQSETIINWDAAHMASLKHQQAVVPASAIKGALSHRVAYHYRCQQKEFADDGDNELSQDCEAVKCLFGYAETGAVDDAGKAGRIIINDLYLNSPDHARQMHNRIDHFTGGVMNSALFEEELLWQTSLCIEMHILEAATIPRPVRKALLLTVEDLTHGWLPLGAGGSRGQGVFNGSVMLSDSDWAASETEAL